ncbi:toprim domain-containing protein [Sphingopyxis sp. GC21]|uniref:DUF7146 domain-containing protein n=1 Tax=Sphingopyxis sp. GC21 TaxID=2933562 RepID=UPI0021E3C104|nr:toprim domain-containing protein [Sphingopyxis sp. GC21]
MPHNCNLDLETAAADLVRRLGGRWNGKFGLCRCPAHADHDPSLSVRAGRRSLLFKCFAGCDTIDVLRALRLLRLDVPTNDNDNDRPPTWRSRDERIAVRARELWNGAWPMRGTPAERYARSRALVGSAATLRYHPRTPLGSGHCLRFRPALLAAVRSQNRVVALERLFLDPVTGLPAADLDPPKRMLGRPLDGAVRFGLPGDTLGLAEGWETGWSAHILLGIPVWASLGSERFGHIAIPDSVTRLILLPDDDQAGRIGTATAREAHDRPGRSIDVWLPDHGCNDWNDQLCADIQERRIGAGQE